MNKNTKKIASIVLVTSSITNVSTLGVFAEGLTNKHTTKIENISTKALQENDIVSIPDENLKRELNYALSQKVDSNITVRQLSSLKKLQLSNKEIKNLEGLQYCTNLTDLQIFNNQIKDISPLSSLGNLTNLSMFNNQISDISVLSDLINLTNLNLGGNQISDVSALSELTSLKSLSLSRNQINDINSLSKLINLTDLDLEGNDISNISSLSRLTNLEWINLNENNLTNTNGLDKLINLKNLSLCENQINDISSLSKLTNLESLGLHTNQISDISSLSNLINLNSLTLFTNQVSDISPLKNLKKLYHINARHQSIVLPAVVSQAGENISVKNEGIGMDGEPIVPKYISNGGILNKSTNYITWKSANISNVDSVSYDFEYYDKENVQIFAGKVTQPIESVSEIKIKNPISGMYVGNNHKLIASVNEKDTENVTWSVDNEDIATISKDGILNAKKPGSVTVTVKLNNSDISKSINIELVNFYDNTNIPS
ncbi:leucine-rich repeat domain-containing protein, partial [[Clostridium] dakarense]|uniref:leucine-rich repeat domain-containing protein n=1 Tax=Faecalimicrobium dakarense TaxID=1301100 RepID=UPI0006946751